MKNKPYKYNSKSRLTTNSQSFPFKVSTIKKDVKANLENTLTKFRIVEDAPEEENESLDKSFFGGRDNNKKSKKEKVSNGVNKLEKVSFYKKIFLTISAVCAVILLLLLSSSFVGHKLANIYHAAKNRVVVLDKDSSEILDDNYLFVGDFQTKRFSFDKYGFDYHYVNNGDHTMTTTYLLNNMKSLIYNYNPSVIFIQLGIVDLNNGMNQDEIINNYEKIIDLIHNNRPNALIFVESVYPINRSVDSFNNRIISSDITNDQIVDFNKKLKKVAEEKNVKYFDCYSLLSANNQLNKKYTDDGVTLNNDGYIEINKKISKLLG